MLLQNRPDLRGLKPQGFKPLYLFLNRLQNRPDLRGLKQINLKLSFMPFITKPTRFKGIETALLLPLYHLQYITKPTRFKGIETLSNEV